MSLLDSLFGTPEKAQAMGLLGAQLMAGNAPAGFLAANQHLAEAPRRALQNKLLEAQYAETLAQGDERKMKLAAMQRQQDIIGRIFGSGAPSQPAAPGQLGSGSFGATSAPAGQPDIPPVQTGGRLARMSADELAMLKINGLDISEAWKAANIPTQMRANSYSMLPGQAPQYMPDPTKGMNFNGGRISTIPGYSDFVAGQTFAQEFPKTVLGAAGQVNLRKNADGTEAPVVSLDENPVLRGMMERFGPTRGMVGAPTPAAPQAAASAPQPASGAPMRIMPDEQRARDVESIRILQSEIDKEQDHGTKAALQRELDRMVSAQAKPGFPTPSVSAASTPRQGQGYGKTTAQQMDEKSRDSYNEVVAKDMAETRKSILGAGFAAPGNIAKYQQLGTLLANVDGGALTATGTQIASAMNSLGLKIDANLPNKEAAAALANQIALEMRNPAGGAGMPGALSDKDREFLVGMAPNAGQTAQGRKMLIEGYISIQRRNQQVATFARNYEKKYGRLDNGFFEQMQAWSNANPLFGGK
jgi:hypothetical protein